jgi:uncharacterized protein (DUF1778 family)
MMARAKKNVKEESVVKEPKEEVVNVRLTTSQKEKLAGIAARRGMGLSTWLLFLALEHAAKEAQ